MAKGTAVVDVLEKMLLQETSPIDMKTLAHNLISLSGGLAGFAGMINDGLKKAAPGSLAHVRYMDLYLKLCIAAEPKEKMSDLGHLTEEDLVRKLQEEIGKAERNGTKTLESAVGHADTKPA